MSFFFNYRILESRDQGFDFFSFFIFFILAVHGFVLLCSTGVDAPVSDYFIDPQVKTWG